MTTTDATNGDLVILNRQTTPSLRVDVAVRASMAIQGFFRDVALDVAGKQIRCWDGGTTGNCRFDLAHLRNPENDTIGSSLTYRGPFVAL